MLGIDVIDLTDPLLKERSDRSLKLISHPYDTPVRHPKLFWLLWTAKEAAFKTRRLDDVFSPKDIPILLTKELEGEITFSSKNTKGAYQITSEYILAIAWNDQKPRFHVLERETSDWSLEIRKEILNLWKMPVTKDEIGLPILDGVSISLTHHGKFGAFAYPTSFLER